MCHTFNLVFLKADGLAALVETLQALVTCPLYTYPKDKILSHLINHPLTRFLHSHMSNLLYEFIVEKPFITPSSEKASRTTFKNFDACVTFR